MLSIQAVRSRTMVKKRNFSAVSTSRALRPSQASSRPFQASTTSRSVAWMLSALAPAYWAWSREDVSWNCWTWKKIKSQITVTYKNSPSVQKWVLLTVTLHCRCLTFTVLNDVCADFDTRRLFSHSSAERGMFLSAHFKSQFKTCTYEQDFGDITTCLEANHSQICNIHKCNTRTFETSSAHTLENRLLSEVRDFLC